MEWNKLFVFFIYFFLIGCSAPNPDAEITLDRETKLPTDTVKVKPETDIYPPILHSDEYENPVPLAIINTKGAEDSPFIYNNELYFFFTPDVRIPVEKQITDGVTGIYFSKKIGNTFQEPERIVLQDKGKLALDGCQFVNANEIWVCSAREGYTGLHWVRAERTPSGWKNWKVDDFSSNYEVGELHIYNDELYYHSSKPGGLGGLDIWKLEKTNGEWTNPVNVKTINSVDDEGWPYITPDGKELWFHRQYKGTPAVFKSEKMNGEWQEPEIIISQFAGEPTLDNEGNLYFVHHYYNNGVMIEADIYVAYKK
jgi:hypothetical protein